LVDALVSSAKAVAVEEMQPRIVKAIEDGIRQALAEERGAVAGGKAGGVELPASTLRSVLHSLGRLADGERAASWSGAQIPGEGDGYTLRLRYEGDGASIDVRWTVASTQTEEVAS
jgi:hypothetical protein